MNKILQLFILSFFITVTYQVTYYDCDDFETEKREVCTSLAGEKSDESCVLVNNECKSIKVVVYTDCGDYTGGNKAECEAITLFNINYKCVLDGSTCKRQLKECTDFKTSYSCDDITSTDGTITKRCLYLNNKCEEHFDDCTTINDQAKCNSNILPISKNTKKCKWETSCVEKDRTCGDYIVGYSAPCVNLEIAGDDENKICIYDEINLQCIENYPSCNLGNQQTCSSILPWDSSTQKIKYNYKCVWENNECKEIKKKM